MLVKARANVNQATMNGNTPLHIAAEKNQIVVVQPLLDAGANVTAEFTRGPNKCKTPLDIAKEKGHIEIVKLLEEYLLKESVQIEKEHYNWTALHRAVYNADVERVKWLIANGAKIVKDSTGRYPHQVSTYEGLRTDPTYLNNRKIVEDLIVNLHKVNELYILQESDKQLFEAVKTGDIEKINKALKEGANINATEPVIDKNDGGYTPLHLAMLKGDVADVLKLLVKNGANLEALDHTDFTPLHYAVYYNQPQAVEALLESEANLEAKTGTHQVLTPLEMAWSMHNNGQDRKSIIEILIQFKALHESKLRYEALQAELRAFKNELDKVKAELTKLQQTKSQEVEQKSQSSIQKVTIQTSQPVILDTVSGQQVSLSPDEKGEVNHQQHSNGNIASSKVSNKDYPEPLLPPLISIENLPLPTEALLKQFEVQSMMQQAKMLKQLGKEIQDVEEAVVEKETFQEVLTEAAMEHNQKLPVQLAAASPDTQPTLKPKEDMAGVRAKIRHEDTLAAIREGVKLKPVPKETLPQGKIKKLIDKGKDLKEIFEAALAEKFKNIHQESDEENDDPNIKNDLLPQYSSTVNRQDHKNLQPSNTANTTSKKRNGDDEDKGFDDIDYAEKFGHK